MLPFDVTLVAGDLASAPPTHICSEPWKWWKLSVCINLSSMQCKHWLNMSKHSSIWFPETCAEASDRWTFIPQGAGDKWWEIMRIMKRIAKKQQVILGLFKPKRRLSPSSLYLGTVANGITPAGKERCRDCRKLSILRFVNWSQGIISGDAAQNSSWPDFQPTLVPAQPHTHTQRLKTQKFLYTTRMYKCLAELHKYPNLQSGTPVARIPYQFIIHN